MTFIFRNRTIFWDNSKWNRGQKKWNGGSIKKETVFSWWSFSHQIIVNKWLLISIQIYKLNYFFTCNNNILFKIYFKNIINIIFFIKKKTLLLFKIIVMFKWPCYNNMLFKIYYKNIVNIIFFIKKRLIYFSKL